MDKSVFKKRVESLRMLMEEKSLDYCIATPGTNFYYITGIDSFRMERLVAAVIPLRGNPFIICPSFELSRFKDATFIEDFYPWGEDENPYELMGKVITSSSSQTAGIEPTTYFETFVNIKKVLSKWEFFDTGKIFSSLRLHKSREEVDVIKKAVDITENNIQSSLAFLKTGMSEYDFKPYLSGNEKLVQFGVTSSYPHAEGGDNILREEDVVLIDKGDMVDKYHSDITRTVHFSKPSEEFVKVWHIVREARDCAIEACEAGVPCEEIDRAARCVIEKAGYGEYFTHRTGHGLGLDIHEEPYIVKGNKNPLEAGNVFTIEPGIYLPGRFGVRIEEDVVITEDGVRVLSERPMEPVIIQ